MNKRSIVVVGSAAALLLVAGVASARNPHCAGGLQYYSQAMNDKMKGNTEDYQREMNKAVDQLAQGATEDPQDFEALGYLGWAYAELDSAGPAGQAFKAAIAGLQAKGDKKRVDVVLTNRDSYWARAYNAGIGSSANPRPVVDFDDDFWDLSLRLNLTVPYLLCKGVLPAMLAPVIRMRRGVEAAAVMIFRLCVIGPTIYSTPRS